MRIYMQTMGNTDNVPRYYQLILQEELLGGWSLIREWGTQGARGRSKREEFSERSEAVQALTWVLRDTDREGSPRCCGIAVQMIGRLTLSSPCRINRWARCWAIALFCARCGATMARRSGARP